MTVLTKKQIKHLRALAHDKKPVVMIGDKGLTENVLEEISNALNTHELIKIKIRADEREEREEMIQAICKQLKCEFVQRVGHVVSLFKRSNEAKIALPKG